MKIAAWIRKRAMLKLSLDCFSSYRHTRVLYGPWTTSSGCSCMGAVDGSWWCINCYFCAISLLFRCHIDATEQQRVLNFELVVIGQLFSVILVEYNWFKIQSPLLLGSNNVTSKWAHIMLSFSNRNSNSLSFICFA